MNNEQLEHQRHSLAHLLAAAVIKLYPGTKRTIGPAIDNGFYYDFEFKEPITEKDLPKIEKEMKKLQKTWHGMERREVTADEAKELFKDNPYKLELINEFSKDGQTLTMYKSSEYFEDLCRGGHSEDVAAIDPDSFKLDKLAGAYWRGDEKNKMLTRIYGLAFESKEKLEEYLHMREEAEKRDHRVLGPHLGLFTFHEYSPGIPFYLPKGSIIRNELEKFVRSVSYGKGYSEVRLPQLFDAELFKISGHWEHYKEDMFTLESEGRTFGLKPMNCPGHMLLYKQGLYSYRDLPLRFAEMSTLYRNELSGTLSGLTRVRAFAQDDCHIFLTLDQVAEEVADLLKRIQTIYAMFGMQVEDVALSTKPEKALGTKEEWNEAEAALAEALKQAGWNYEINEGDGAFYGPKIDMRIKDALGRKWQLATIQLDFQQPKRFELEYVTEDGTRKTPVVIHRALIGSFERFFAILIEHYAGNFPLWLSPVQLAILPISDNQLEYARSVHDQLLAASEDLRIETDKRAESIGKKIREATLQKIPYQIIVGEKEALSGHIAIRTRSGEDLGAMSVQKFAEKILAEIKSKK